MKQHSLHSSRNLKRTAILLLLVPLTAGALLFAAGAGKPEGEKAKKFDPIEVNGKFFEGWPKPDLAILITGRQDGYIEPCGCAGLENQKGGIGRRHALVKQLLKDKWPLLEIDAGGLVHRFGRQAELKFAISAEALKTMGYQAVGFGADDLRLSGGELAAVVGANDVNDSMFVSANVSIFGLTPRVKIFKQAGRTIGVTSVLGDSYQKTINNPDIELESAAKSLKAVMPQLKDCNLKVLLANATLEESKALAKEFPQFDVVVAADGGYEPLNHAEKFEGRDNRLIVVGHKGMFAIVLGFYTSGQPKIRYQRVALDSRFDVTPEMKTLMVNYQNQLQALGWQGLELRSVPHPRGSGHDKLWGEFAGVKSCQACHADAYKVWQNSKHAHATDTLEKLNPPRQFDPECISCHATGWNPQEFFPYASGFVSSQLTPQLANNTCENCHGPGAAHVAAEAGADEKQKQELREVMKVSKDNLCIKCHDGDNDPAFKLETYWPQIEH
jgi:hypothetical protein